MSAGDGVYMNWVRITIGVLVVVLAVLGGILIASLAAPSGPGSSQGVPRAEQLADDDEYTSIPQELEDTPAVAPRVASVADAERIREQLIEYLWKGSGLPLQLTASSSDTDISAPAFIAGVEHVRQADRHTIVMRHDVTSSWYHLASDEPVDGRSCLLVFSSGHVDIDSSTELIGWTLEHGCDVVMLNMPLVGPDNSTPVVDHPERGVINLRDHNAFAALDTETFSPVTYFIDPVVAAVNTHGGSYDTVAMAGLSGGGWTTTLAAALDVRIELSFPVAGTLPLDLGTWQPKRLQRGDWEQFATGMHLIAGYRDLYVMGTTGGRSQIQILNQFDPCCFAGLTAETYRGPVSAAAEAVGGRFDLRILEHDVHEVGDEAIRIIVDELVGK